jgi:mannose-6-phosphate isomerase-like protein (cupin superfamily)
MAPHDIADDDIMTELIDSTVPIVVPAGAGTVPTLTHPNLPRIEVKLDGTSGADFSVLEYIVPAHFAPPPVLHRHTKESATGYIVDGHITYWFDGGAPVEVGPGGLVHLPAGAWFRWANQTDHPVRMLFVFKPAGFEQFFIELMDALDGAGGQPSDIGKVIFPLRAKYGDEQYQEA